MKRWPIKPLGELAGGGQYGLNAAAMSEGTGVRFVRITDITQAGELRHEEPAFVPDDTPELDDYELKDGDILIARSGATAGKSYIHHSFGERAVFAGYLIRFQPDTTKLLPRFIGAFLQTPDYWRQLNSHKRAVAQPNVNAKQLASIVMPIPPIAEQERIVKLLDEADELRKLRAQADRRSADLIPALFHEMFGDPALNPRRWKLTAISEMAEVQGGLQLTPLRSTYSLKRAYLRVANVQRGFLVLDEIKEIGLLDSEYERTKLAKGDLLLVEGNGNPKEVGRAAIWDDSVEDCVHQNHLIRVRPNSKSLTSEYLLAFVNSESGRSYFHGSGNTTSGLVTISTSIVKNCRIPIPPLPLQQEFAQRVSEIRALQAAQAASRQRTEHLFQSMLHRAFNQEL